MAVRDRAPIPTPRTSQRTSGTQISYGSAPSSTFGVFRDPTPFNPNLLGDTRPTTTVAPPPQFSQTASAFQVVSDSDPPPLPPRANKQQPVEQLQHKFHDMNFHGNGSHANPSSTRESVFSDPSYPSHPHHHPSHIPSIQPSTFSDSDGKKDDEIHILRMLVSDKEAQIKRISSELDFANEEIRRLNVQLSDKKEVVLKYQEKISDLSSDNSALQQLHAAGPSPAETALQTTVQSLRQQLIEHERQLHMERQRTAELQRQLSEHPAPFSPAQSYPPPLPQAQPYPHEDSQAELRLLRQQMDSLHSSRNSLSRQNEGLKSEVQLLTHQVATYSEDFRSERLDRERAQSKIQSLKEENDSLRQAINLLAAEHGIRLDAYGLHQPPGNRL